MTVQLKRNTGYTLLTGPKDTHLSLRLNTATVKVEAGKEKKKKRKKFPFFHRSL